MIAETVVFEHVCVVCKETFEGIGTSLLFTNAKGKRESGVHCPQCAAIETARQK